MDLLLELRSEEIPARMQARARDDLARLFAAELAAAGLAAREIVTYTTPRRLALIARDLPPETQATREEVKGPRANAPPQALEGFLRKTGLTREDLTERDGVLYAVTQKPGRATLDVLAAAIPAIIRAFPWPKSMRWGAASTSTESLRWVRPLQGIVALFGDDIVPVEIAGIRSGAATVGHRFHHPGPITLGGADDYLEKLRACHVLVDHAERATLIRDGARALAVDAGLDLIEDEGLVIENAGLTEWPVPLLGRFDEAFLEVPPEVIQLTARVNQKYFVCRDGHGALANAFICTANIEATDGGARIVEGNRKVLAARLADARFFFEQDAKIRLEDHAAKLDKIVFHEKLGTVADKVDRVAKLARWLVEEGIVSSNSSPERGGGPSAPADGGGGPATVAPAENPHHHPAAPDGPPPRAGEELSVEALATLAERAARLCKADLVTGMVGEFPELQGVMGGYYATAQGEDPQVAAAIRDHYKPVGHGDEVPTAPVTVAVSLADKLDTLVGFFGVNQPPTGSKDPFALRRAAIAVLQILNSSGLRLSLSRVHERGIQPYIYTFVNRISRERADRDQEAASRMNVAPSAALTDAYVEQLVNSPDVVAFVEGFSKSATELLNFFADRLKVQQREAGIRHDLIDAVFALGGEDDLVRLLARVHALQAFVATPDGANLLAGYKRAANILKKEGWTPAAPLLVGEGQGAQAPRGEDREHTATSLSSPSHSAAPSGPLPLLQGEGQQSLSYTPEPAESALMLALDSAEPRARDAVAAEDFAAAMQALASLRAPIDAFFDAVTVNDPAPRKRAARLALLARVRDSVHAVADFSKIEG